jgi:hypothetical protein
MDTETGEMVSPKRIDAAGGVEPTTKTGACIFKESETKEVCEGRSELWVIDKLEVWVPSKDELTPSAKREVNCKETVTIPPAPIGLA